MKRINLYFRRPAEKDRYLPGDRYIRQLARRLFRKKKASGVNKVFANLCIGFDELNIKYVINPPFADIKPQEPVVVLGVSKYALQGYEKSNPIIAGIALVNHPSDWPSMCKDYPIAKYLQHSTWAKNVYVPYYGSEVCDTWPAGIDTHTWSPDVTRKKKYDVLIYNKIRWNYSRMDNELRTPIINRLNELGLSYTEIVYGDYAESEYLKLLHQSRSMIFLCEHESQGFACCEALSMDIPVFAWDQKHCLDPERFKWGTPYIPSSSVPFFNEDCGMTFFDYRDFDKHIKLFWSKVVYNAFKPRNYILENLTLKKSAERMLAIIYEIYT